MDMDIRPHAIEPTPLRIPVAHGPRRAPTLSILNRCLPECEHCRVLGCLAPDVAELSEIDRRMENFAKSGFSRVSFPPNALISESAQLISALARTHGLVPVLKISSAYPMRTYWPTLVIWLRDGAEFEIVLDKPLSTSETELLLRIEAQVPGRVTPVIVPSRRHSIEELCTSLPPSIRSKAQLLISLQSFPKDATLTCDEIQNQLDRLSRANFPIALRPYQSFDQEDGSLPDWFPINYDLKPAFESKSFRPAPKLSIVIAATNRKEELINCIRHLQKQTQPTDDFEVVIVDDGSSDGSFIRIREHFTRNSSRFNLRYFILDRPFARTPGDDLYRVGQARNFGAAKTAGKDLFFLNPEALVSPEFVADAVAQLESATSIQYPYYLVPFKKSSQRPRFSDLKARSFKRIFDPKWNVDSGVAFGLSKIAFNSIGGFANAFHTFGFEDAFLAWQLKQAGHTIVEGKKEIFYLEPTRESSEYANSLSRKKKISRVSARLFYALTLDSGFYRDHFASLNGLGILRKAVSVAGRSWLGRVLLHPLYFALLLAREPKRIRQFFARSRA